MVWINCYKRVHPGSPFGGVGQSGYGREMGFEAMREYTQAEVASGSTSMRRARRFTSDELRDCRTRCKLKAPCFIHEARPGRVIFGWGARCAVGEELARLGVERAMIITTPSRADVAAEFARLLLGRVGIVYPGAQPNAPIEVTEAALTAASSVKADGLLAIGGGTAIGLSKAISLRTNLPQVVAPTTFSGCEMAPFLSETERGARVERRSQDVLPRTTVYDPELVAHLPPSVAGPSAMNARRDRSARRIDVQLDILLGIFLRQKEHLRNHQVGNVVVIGAG